MKGKFIRSKFVLVCMRFRIHRYVAAPHSGPFFSVYTTIDPFFLTTEKFGSVYVLIINPVCVTMHISKLT
jgi:hypothetical protein